MANSFIPIAGTSEKLQSFENSIGGVDVHSEAVTPTDQTGVPFTATNRFPTSVSDANVDFRVSQSRASYVLNEDGNRIPTEDGLGWLMADSPSGNPTPWWMRLRSWGETDTVLSAANPLPVNATTQQRDANDTSELFAINLTWRMGQKMPAFGYRMWLETGLTTFIYQAEALASAVATDATAFRGIRTPLNAQGNPSGKVEVNLAFKWSDKSGGTWT